MSDFYIGQYNALARRFNELSNALRELAPQVGEMERRVQAQDQELRVKDARIADLEAKLLGVNGYATMLQFQIREMVDEELARARAAERDDDLRSQQT